MADERLLGREYVLHEEIGHGAMAVVHRATSRLGGPALAAKIIRPECADLRVRDLFLREEAALRALRHDSVVAVKDLVVEGGRIALVMELVDGPNLRRHLADRGGLLPVAEAVALARPVADALAVAHAHGIVHLDVKPENVLVVRGGRPVAAKLGDFGLAGILREAGATVRGGTPGYLAPEIAGGGRATTAADVYALGVLLAELITGSRPERGRTDLAAVPPPLRDLVGACLSDDPGRRPSASSVAARLRSVDAPAYPEGPHQQPTRLRRQRAAQAEEPGPAARSRRGRIVAIAAGATVLAAVAGALLAGGILARDAGATARPSVTASPPATATATVAPPATTPPAGPPVTLDTTPLAEEVPAAPRRATYAEHLPGDRGTLYIAVRDGTAIAYLCDGKRVEAWFSGPADDGTLSLKSRKGGTLTGRYDAGEARGRVTAAGRATDFVLPPAGRGSGLFRSLGRVNGAEVRGSWIVLADGTQVGVVTVDEEPRPAPRLDTATGTAELDSAQLTVTPVDAESGEGF